MPSLRAAEYLKKFDLVQSFQKFYSVLCVGLIAPLFLEIHIAALIRIQYDLLAPILRWSWFKHYTARNFQLIIYLFI